jgi:hypothetical protein
MGFLRRLLGGSSAPATEPIPTLPATDTRERLDLRGELPPGCEVLVQGPPVKVVGESFYRDAIQAAVGLRPEGHRTIVDAAIVLDSLNPVDPGAVAIWIGGQVCGHMSRADAVEWHPVIAWYAHNDITPVARGDVNGGWLMEDGTWANYGITLYVATPQDLAARQRQIDSRAVE